MYTVDSIEDYKHVNSLGVCRRPLPNCLGQDCMLSFDALVLNISLWLPSILWYRWVSERQFVVGSLLWTLDHQQWPSR